MSELQTEFGGDNPISFSEYYKSGGNGYVPSTVLPVYLVVILLI